MRSSLPYFENWKKMSWFWKKRAPVLEKSVLFMCIYGLNSHLKCNFKSALEKKHQNFSLRDPSFVCRTWNVYRSASIARNLSCLKNILGTHLILYGLFHHVSSFLTLCLSILCDLDFVKVFITIIWSENVCE